MTRYSENPTRAANQEDFLVEVIWGLMFTSPEEVCKTFGTKPMAIGQRLQRMERGDLARPFYRLNNQIQREKKRVTDEQR